MCYIDRETPCLLANEISDKYVNNLDRAKAEYESRLAFLLLFFYATLYRQK